MAVVLFFISKVIMKKLENQFRFSNKFYRELFQMIGQKASAGTQLVGGRFNFFNINSLDDCGKVIKR